MIQSNGKKTVYVISGRLHAGAVGTNDHPVICNEDWFAGLVYYDAIGDEAVEFSAYIVVT